MPGPHEIFVVDTSSLLSVRETYGREAEKELFSGLSDLVAKGALVYPPQVLHELELGSESATNPDPPVLWARTHQAKATIKPALDRVKETLGKVPDVIDPDAKHEQADPYILTLAVQLKEEGYDVVVVTEDRRDKPAKTSLATACGVLKIPTVPLRAFLRSEGLADR